MNILELEDVVKGMPDQALHQEAQAPSGQIPQFLTVSEIQRRTKMRKDQQRLQQSATPPPVAQQIVQEGIASMQPPPQAPRQMASGGIVKMAEGGGVPRLRSNLWPSSVPTKDPVGPKHQASNVYQSDTPLLETLLPETYNYWKSEGPVVAETYKDSGFGAGTGQLARTWAGQFPALVRDTPLGRFGPGIVEAGMDSGVDGFLASLFGYSGEEPVKPPMAPEGQNPPAKPDSMGETVQATEDATKSNAASTGAPANTPTQMLMDMVGEGPVSTPDYSEDIQNMKDMGWANALVNIGAGIAGGDISQGLARAADDATRVRGGIRELSQSQKEAEMAAQIADRRSDVAALSAAGQVQQTSEALQRELERQAGMDRRATLDKAGIIYTQLVTVSGGYPPEGSELTQEEHMLDLWNKALATAMGTTARNAQNEAMERERADRRIAQIQAQGR